MSVEEWEAIHQSRHWGTYPEVYMVRQVKAFMARRAWKVVTALDIGCGAGAHTWMMQRERMHVCAVDISPTAIARLAHAVPDVYGMVGDIREINIAEASQSFILDNLSLTHVENPPLERILSWLKPGGRLVSASFLVPPQGAPKSWPVHIGNQIETHTREINGHTHVIGLHLYEKPNA